MARNYYSDYVAANEVRRGMAILCIADKKPLDMKCCYIPMHIESTIHEGGVTISSSISC